MSKGLDEREHGTTSGQRGAWQVVALLDLLVKHPVQHFLLLKAA